MLSDGVQSTNDCAVMCTLTAIDSAHSDVSSRHVVSCVGGCVGVCVWGGGGVGGGLVGVLNLNHPHKIIGGLGPCHIARNC